CAPAPQFLPNSTLETYIQHDIGVSGGIPQSTSSCIACHNNAIAYQRIDFGDRLSLQGSDKKSDAEEKCRGARTPGVSCSPASDFTYILEQVCAPMADPRTDQPQRKSCKRDH